MSVVKINAIQVPKDKQERFEERFKGRAGAVEKTPGFEWFELLRPLEGTDQYLVYTRWSSEEAYRTWQSGQDFDRAHDGGGDTLAPAAVEAAPAPSARLCVNRKSSRTASRSSSSPTRTMSCTSRRMISSVSAAGRRVAIPSANVLAASVSTGCPARHDRVTAGAPSACTPPR